MGLDAVVYKNLNNVDVDEDHLALVDETTGEVYLDDPKLAGKYGEETFEATPQAG